LSVQPSNRIAVEVIPLVSLLLLGSRGVYLDLERFENTKFKSDKDFRHTDGVIWLTNSAAKPWY
jgi:hypothetical protein